MTNLTKREQEIMEVLWGSDEPMLISEILEVTKHKRVAKNSVLPMIRKLIEEGFIKVTGNKKVAKTHSRYYAPALTIDEYAAVQLSDLSKASNRKVNVGAFLSYFVKNGDDGDKIIADIEEFIDNYKKEHK